MIKCKELNKTFQDKKELFKALRANKSKIIADKRAMIQKSAEKGVGIKARFIKPDALNEHNKALNLDDAYYYLAVNSTRILDSHDDLHLDGLWNKTVNEQQGRNYLVLDHQLTVSSTVVRKEHIEMFTTTVPFSLIGKSYEGETEVLVYKFLKTDIKNEIAKEWLESGDDIEASVRMQYVKIDIAMDSLDEEDKEAKRVFEKYYPMIANKSDYDEILYFFPITEAKNIRESSLVLAGSNGATGILSNKNIEPSKDTHTKDEAERSLQENQVQFYLNT